MTEAAHRHGVLEGFHQLFRVARGRRYAFEQGGIGRAGADHIEVDVFGRQFPCQGFRQTDQSRLAGGVNGFAGGTDTGRIGSHIDDLAAPRFKHLRQDHVVHVQRPGQVDRDQLLPHGRLGFEERHEAVEACVVNQYGRYTEVFFNGRDGVDNGGVIGDVGGVSLGLGLAVRFVDQVDGGLCGTGIAIKYGDQAAFGSEAQAHGPTNAATAAGDDYGSSNKTFHAAVLILF
ncbi:hypothetical protein D3C87_1455390 [compost metagenome]